MAIFLALIGLAWHYFLHVYTVYIAVYNRLWFSSSSSTYPYNNSPRAFMINIFQDRTLVNTHGHYAILISWCARKQWAQNTVIVCLWADREIYIYIYIYTHTHTRMSCWLNSDRSIRGQCNVFSHGLLNTSRSTCYFAMLWILRLLYDMATHSLMQSAHSHQSCAPLYNVEYAIVFFTLRSVWDGDRPMCT